ncbi:hypothetical protein WBP07_22385 (plasmid) [Novosphingobium sp. BL-8A]
MDAQAESEFETRHGVAVSEASPAMGVPEENSALRAKRAEKQSDHEAVSSQPDHDPNGEDPNERSDMISERRNPGMHGGGGDPGWKSSRDM